MDEDEVRDRVFQAVLKVRDELITEGREEEADPVESLLALLADPDFFETSV